MKYKIEITEVDNGFILEDPTEDGETMVFEDCEQLLNHLVAKFYESPLGRSSMDFRVEIVDSKKEEYAETIVVTRHKALLQLLQEKLWLSPVTPIIEHATAEDIKGKHVIGVLPLSLACLAASITEVTLDIPFALRGQELTLEQLKEFYIGERTYKVKEIDND